MKGLLFLLLATFAIAACTRIPSDSGKSRDSLMNSSATEMIKETICFQKLSGTNNQDTAFIRLIVEGDRVTGDFSNIPYEKDSKIGTIQARKEGELIKGLWAYMQEGMNDTLELEFRLAENKLIQKNHTVDPQTGREVLSDQSEFNIEFTQVDCR